MPLRDQDGNETDEIAAYCRVEVSKVVVAHDEVVFFVGDDVAFTVTHPRHPGAGLALDIADWVATS